VHDISYWKLESSGVLNSFVLIWSIIADIGKYCATFYYDILITCSTASVVRILGYRSRGPGSIPGTTRKKKKKKVVGSGMGCTQPCEYKLRSYLIEKQRLLSRKPRIYGRKDPSRWPRGTLYPQVGNHFADKRRSLGRYSSLVDSDHGVFFLLLPAPLTLLQSSWQKLYHIMQIHV
jgi:hypothetical protein